MEEMRRAAKEDMKAIYMMGYDVWGEDIPPKEYLTRCRNSSKYKKGEWYVLVNKHTKKPLSSLIIYRLNASVDSPVIGIGSIATPPDLRNQGFASKLIKKIIYNFEKSENCSGFYLYSDIGTTFYERLGFASLPMEKQKYQDSMCMFYSKEIDSDTTTFDVPDYF